MPTRRDALRTFAGTVIGAGLTPAPAARPRSTFGLAYTSFVVRLLQGRDIMKTDAARLAASSFFDLCHRFGAAGGQADLTQFDARDPASLAELRRGLQERGLFAELSIPARTLETPSAFDEAAAIAQALGTTRLRVALLSGRRYESFRTAAEWEAFERHWRDVLPRIRPAVEHHGLQLGIENHKDWTATELAALLDRIGSASIGACVDFGNNLSFLEDPMHTVSTLAPWAITTHLKDMAFRATDTGLDLSEVPLGAGMLPLAPMVDTLRRAKPDLHFCLEMITRDPLPVPYESDAYWIAFGGRDDARVAAFERELAPKASVQPLPRITGLSPEAQIAAEDENVRRSESYARSVLGL